MANIAVDHYYLSFSHRHNIRLKSLHMCWEWAAIFYTPYEGPTLANKISRKLGVFDRKLEGILSLFYCLSGKAGVCVFCEVLLSVTLTRPLVFKDEPTDS